MNEGAGYRVRNEQDRHQVYLFTRPSHRHHNHNTCTQSPIIPQLPTNPIDKHVYPSILNAYHFLSNSNLNHVYFKVSYN